MRLWHLESSPVGPPVRNLDLEAVSTEGTDRRSFYRDGPYFSATPPVFRALCPHAQLTDAPFCTNGWPVVSTRVAGVFALDAVTFPVWVRHRDGTVDTTSFVLCTAKTLVDGLDLDASQTTPNPFRPGSPPRVLRPVVRSNIDWPRLVRLRHYPVRQLVNDAAREALLTLGARGLRFREVAQTP